MKAITELRKTGWYLVIDEDGTSYTDDEGNMYFSGQIARDLGRKFRVMPYCSKTSGVKDVVVGYR